MSDAQTTATPENAMSEDKITSGDSAAGPKQDGDAQAEAKDEAPAEATQVNEAKVSSSLSASAVAFVPKGTNSATEKPKDNFGPVPFNEVVSPEKLDPTDVLSKLPPMHKSMLRGWYYDSYGQQMSYYVGALKSFSKRTGYGFLECAQSMKDWGADIFIHKNYVPCPWHIGQPIEFAIVVNAQGRPQAADVKWLPRLPQHQQVRTGQTIRAPVTLASMAKPSQGQAEVAVRPPTTTPPVMTMAVPGVAPPGKFSTAEKPAQSLAVGGQGAGAGIVVGPTSALGSAPLSGTAVTKRCLGKLKSFSPAQGYGFIQSDEAFDSHKRDIYFDKSQITVPKYYWGQVLEFNIVFNSRGQPQARNMNWNPVPVLPEKQKDGDSKEQAPEKTYSQDSLEKLQKLLGDLGRQNYEAAIVTAIDNLGGSSSNQASKSAENDQQYHDVDYVTFVLDRVKMEDIVHTVKDFVKMLLILFLAKTLRRPFSEERCKQLTAWFVSLAQSIRADAGGGVREHIYSVTKQVETNVDTALRDETHNIPAADVTQLKDALQVLKEKASGAGTPAAP